MEWKRNVNSEILLADSKENFNNRRIVKYDPDIVLQELIYVWLMNGKKSLSFGMPSKQMLIMIVQRGSSYWQVLQPLIKNKYIHSGCGRIARLKMRPMSLFESCHSSGLISLKDIYDENAKNILTGDVNLKDLLNYFLSGGWSPLLN